MSGSTVRLGKPNAGFHLRSLSFYLIYMGVITPVAILSPLLYFLIAPKSLIWWMVTAAPWLAGLMYTTFVRLFRRSCSVDHIVFTCPTLEAGIEYVYERTGVRAAHAGSHPGVGTHNALLSLGDDCYLEIIAPDPNQPEPDQPRPFSLDDPRTHFRFNAFAVHPNPPTSMLALVNDMVVRGLDPGPIHETSRRKPDGSMLSWQLTSLSVAAGPRPWLIDWGATPSPASSSPEGCTLVNLRCYGPQAREMDGMLHLMGLQPLALAGTQGFEPVVEFCHHEAWRFPRHENNFLIATLQTPDGLITFGESWGR